MISLVLLLSCHTFVLLPCNTSAHLWGCEAVMRSTVVACLCGVGLLFGVGVYVVEPLVQKANMCLPHAVVGAVLVVV